jgi:heme oxygenase
MSLKEITADLHRQAEQTEFTKTMITGKLTDEQYAQYLYQLIPIYSIIEFGNRVHGNLESLAGIERTQRIYEDFCELAGEFADTYYWLPVTQSYQQYLFNLLNDPERRHLIKAHLYCRHMGDLFGGQMIASRVPGSGKFYQFDNIDTLKTNLRAQLTDDLGDEARIAFKWAIQMAEELYNDF